MMKLEVWLDQDLVGWLAHDGATNRFSFEYTPQWRAGPRSFPITPRIPLEQVAGQTPESHSAEVRQFFENLLPEGEALDHAAQANGISRSNLIGLMIALGKETAGALRLAVAREGTQADDQHTDHEQLRLVTKEELSSRIQQRALVPFSVWDGRVRLSIAGHQDKMAIYQRGDKWYLVEGSHLASTVILKPMPTGPQLATLPDNEYMCMQLAQRSGLDVSATQLVHVPEPVLFVRRFDRVEADDHVRRLHIIDGCQALGLSSSMKYERPYGDGRDVRNIRDGATYAKLFSLLGQSPQPARDRQALLRWVIFQVLIGNTDAHGKNISFFCGIEGLRLAPFYDLVCIPALGHSGLSDTFAMAIGDAFTEAAITPVEWARFAKECGLPFRMVSSALERLAVRILDQLSGVEKDIRLAGVHENVIASVHSVVQKNCLRHAKMAIEILQVKQEYL